MSERMPRCSELARGRFGQTLTFGEHNKVVAFLAVAFMVISSLMPLGLVMPVKAYTQNYSYEDTNFTVVPVPDGGMADSNIFINVDYVVSQVDVVHWSISRIPAIPRESWVNLQVDLVLYDDFLNELARSPLSKGAGQVPLFPTDRSDSNVPGFAGTYHTKGIWALEVTDIAGGNGRRVKIDYFDLIVYYNFVLEITAPAIGENIRQTYTITADVENSATTPELWFDGIDISNMIYTGTDWEYSLDTTAYKDGVHNLRIVAKDAISGNTVSEIRGVKIDNYNFSTAPVTITQPNPLGPPLSGSQTFRVDAPSFTEWASLSIDDNVVQTSNTINYDLGLGVYYYEFTVDTSSYPDGTHRVTGIAYDPDNNYGADTQVYTFQNNGLTVNIWWPTSADTLGGPWTYTVWVQVVQGSPIGARLYVDGQLYCTTSGAPPFGVSPPWQFYALDWNTVGLSNGIHTLMAELIGPFGEIATDTEYPTVLNYQDLAVTITGVYNQDGTSYPSSLIYGKQDYVTATTLNYVLKCELFIDNTLVTMQTGPGITDYTLYFDSTNYRDGAHQVSVRAYDPNGNWKVDPWSVEFDNWHVSVDITAPDPTIEANISGNKYIVLADVVDAQYADLFVDGRFIQRDNSPGVQAKFQLDTTAFSDGTHTLTVIAHDQDDNIASDSVTIPFANWFVWITISSPITGAKISGSSSMVRATADQNAVKGELYLDGTLVDTFYGNPINISGSYYYFFSFDTRAFKDGSHTLTARAYAPDGNFATNSIAVTIDNIRYLVDITNPVDKTTLTKPGLLTVSVRLNPYTNGDATSAECLVDNLLVASTNTVSANFNMPSFDTRNFKDGPHSIKVIVYDKDGGSAFDVHSVIFDNYAISVTISSPVEGSLIKIPTTITATVPTEATKAEYFIDGLSLGVVTKLPAATTFTYSLNPALYSDGQHSITVTAYDPDGNYATDTNVYTFDFYNLLVSITTPTSGAYIKGTINVRVNTNSISDSVKLYVDSVLVTSSSVLKVTGGDYDFTLVTTGFSDGSHILKAEASYSRSKETSTASMSVIIDNTLPTVTDVTVTYLNGLTAVRASGDKVSISAKVSDLTSGINTVILDATNIEGASSLTMLDDGSHNDGGGGDGVYGSGPIDASGKMGHMRIFVKATDKATNSYTGSASVAIDDHAPIITSTYVMYPGAQTAAKTGDDVRVIAKIVDTTVFVDVILILDNSNSIGVNFPTVQDDAKDFVDSLNQNDMAAVYSFDGENKRNSLKPKREIDFTSDKDAVKNTIDSIVANDGTPLYDTIYDAIQYAKNSNNLPVIIALTDGNDFSLTHPNIDDVKYASIPIFTIGLEPVGGMDPINKTALKAIADTSNGGAYYYSPTISELQQIYQTIAGKIKEFEVGGISSAYVDLLNIGAGSNNPIYDDGAHGDGTAKDNVFGSNIITITSAATDQFNYTVHATDVGGNTAQLVGTIKIDNTPPTVTFVKPLFQTLNWWASDGDMVQFSATVSDLGNVGGVATVRLDATAIGGGPNVVMRDDGTNGDVTAGDGIYTSDQVQISTGLSTGLKVVTVYATDIAANAGSGAGGIYIDNHRPMILELVSPAANQYIEGKYTFQVRSNDISGIDQVQINIDNKWYTMAYNTQSGYYELILNTSTMQDGAYKATVQATDIAGKVNNGPADQIFFIDNTPPTLVLNYPKDGDVVSGLVRINTTGTTDRFLAAIEYKADDLAWAPVTTLWNTTKLVDGQHTLTVRAKDSIGHETTRTIKVIVDNGNPEAYFVTPITGQALSGKVTFQIWATDSVQVTGVALTGSIIGLMEHNSVTGYYELIVDTTLMVDGTYTVGGLVMDPGGHILTLAPVTFYVDNGFPVIKVIKPVNNAILKGNVSVQLNVTDGPFSPVSVQWRVDEGAWKNVTVQSFWWNTTTYSDAKHTFYVQASDRAGHLVSTSVAITIDNNPPTIEMASPINGQFIEGLFIFKIHSYDTVGVDKVVLQIEGVNNWTIINNVGTIYFEQAINTTKIKDGSYYVSATSYDLSGYSTKGTRIKINIDNNAPQLLVYSPTDGEYISGENYTISGVATDTYMSSIVYDVDGFGERPINKTLDTTLLADGEHAVSVIAKDLAGHITTKKVRVYIDNSRPTVSAVSPQPLEAVSGRYTFRVSAQDINGIANVTLIYGNVTIPMFLNSVNGYFEAIRDTIRDQDGQKSFVFKATDKSGKVTNLTLTTQLDNNAPTVTVQSPTDSARGTIRFRVQATDPSGVAQVLVRIGGSDWRDMREDNGSYVYSWKTAYSDNGDQAYDIKAVDKLGNSKVYSFGLTVSNPSGKQNFDWLWLLLFIMLVVCLLAVVLTSRTRSSSNSQRDYRAAPRGYDTRMAAEEDYTGAPRPLPGRMAGPGGRQPPTDQVKELGTPAHKVAMRQLQQDVVVSQPSEDEVQFMSTDDDMAQAPMAVGALRSTDALDQGDEDVEFLDDETSAPDGGDEVSFDEDGSDEVSFSPDSGDEVAFMDESPAPGGDEVSFSDDSGDDVSFTDDSATASDEDIQFLDDEALPAPKPKPPARRVPVTLTPRRATATPAVTPKRPPPSVSKGAIAGIDDLLSGGGGTPRPASRTAKPPAPKAKPAPAKGDNPLGDLIGDL